MAKVRQLKSKARLTRAMAREAAAYALGTRAEGRIGVRVTASDRERFLGHFGSVGSKKTTRENKVVVSRTASAV